MAESFFIDDGYTRDFKIAARPGIHPEMTGKYRPVHPDDRMALKHHSMQADVFATRCVALVAKNVITWNAGEPVTVDNVRKLEPNLFSDLLDYVLAYNYDEASKTEKN